MKPYVYLSRGLGETVFYEQTNLFAGTSEEGRPGVCPGEVDGLREADGHVLRFSLTLSL